MVILTFMICNLCRDDAKGITDKLRKITVADIMESMEVSVIPYAIHDGDICSIHKLKINLYKPDHYPKHTDITEEDWQETMAAVFLRKLEDAIETHMKMLIRMRGIQDEKEDTRPKSGNDVDNEDSVSGKQTEDNDDDEDEGTEVDDLGSDAQKQKKQAIDERDYEESSSDDEKNEPSSTSGVEDPEMDNEDDNAEVSKEETMEPQEEAKNVKEGSKKKRQNFVRNKHDKHFSATGKGKTFEVHFKFGEDDPHILLAQVPFC